MVMAQASSFVMLPLLSRYQNSPDLFHREYKLFVQLIAIGSIATMVPLILSGEQILRLCFGSKYAGGGDILAWLAAACGFRFLRIAPATAAMARADTQNQMVSNLFRLSSLLACAGVIFIRSRVEAMAACALFGELVALFISTYRLNRRQAIPSQDTLNSAIYLAACLGIAGIFVFLGVHTLNLPTTIAISAVVVLFVFGVSRVLFPQTFGRLSNSVALIINQRPVSRNCNQPANECTAFGRSQSNSQ